MNQDSVRKILAGADTDDWDRIFAVWWSPTLRPLDSAAIPLIREQFKLTRHWQGRAAQLHYITGFARHAAEARDLAIEALNDPSLEVRYRACVLLAHSQSRGAICRLKGAAIGSTARFANAAIAAIEGKSMEPMTALDGNRRNAYFLPIKLPRRAWNPLFAEEFDALSSKWLKALGFAPQSVFQHDAFYRRDDTWFHAYWEQWDVLWLFMFGSRAELGQRGSYVGNAIPQSYAGGSLKQASHQLQQELKELILA